MFPESGSSHSHHSRLYGLLIESPFALPRERVTREPPDVVLAEASSGTFEHARSALAARTSTPEWFEHVPLKGGEDYLYWEDLFEFLVSEEGRRVDFLRSPGASDVSLVTYLLGQVLSFSLLKLGAEPMHATVVEVGGSALGFLGETGSGKSTVAAALLAGGARLVTDDLLVVRRHGEQLLCEPGPDRIKLYPEIADRLLPGLSGGEPMHPQTGKRVLALPPEYAVTSDEAPPLRSLFVLERGPSLRPLRPAEAFVELVRYTFNTIVDDSIRMERQFEAATELSSRIPVGLLGLPDDLDRLEERLAVVLGGLEA